MRFNKKDSENPNIRNNAIITKIIKTINNEGFYLVLFICFCIVSAAAVWTVKANVERIQNMNERENIEFVNENMMDDFQVAEDNDAQPVSKEDKEESNAPDLEEQEDVSTTNEVENSEINEVVDQEDVVSNMPVFSVPVQGNICLDYSGDTLVYSKTLDQYIIHKGIDLEAPLNEPVCAAADGVISKIEEDKKMGITIWISHKNDFVTIYSNLSTANMVREGDQVKKGDVISGVGDTALFEILEVPHLHFEVMRNQRHEDPQNFINF